MILKRRNRSNGESGSRDFPARGEVSVNCCPSSGFEASDGVGFGKAAETLCLVRLESLSESPLRTVRWAVIIWMLLESLSNLIPLVGRTRPSNSWKRWRRIGSEARSQARKRKQRKTITTVWSVRSSKQGAEPYLWWLTLGLTWSEISPVFKNQAMIKLSPSIDRWRAPPNQWKLRNLFHLEMKLRAHLVFTKKATGYGLISYVRFRHLSYWRNWKIRIFFSSGIRSGFSENSCNWIGNGPDSWTGEA